MRIQAPLPRTFCESTEPHGYRGLAWPPTFKKSRNPLATPESSAILEAVLDPTWAIETLYAHYNNVNREKFFAALPSDYTITFNPRLRRLTGRITYSSQLIEISSFHYFSYGFCDAKATIE